MHLFRFDGEDFAFSGGGLRLEQFYVLSATVVGVFEVGVLFFTFVGQNLAFNVEVQLGSAIFGKSICFSILKLTASASSRSFSA